MNNKLDKRFAAIPLGFWKIQENFHPAIVPTQGITGSMKFFEDLPAKPQPGQHIYYNNTAQIEGTICLVSILIALVISFIPWGSNIQPEILAALTAGILCAICIIYILVKNDSGIRNLLTIGKKTPGRIDEIISTKDLTPKSRNGKYRTPKIFLKYDYFDDDKDPVSSRQTLDQIPGFKTHYSYNQPIGLLTWKNEEGYHYSRPYPLIHPFTGDKSITARVEEFITYDNCELLIFSFFNYGTLYVGAVDWQLYADNSRPIPGSAIKIAFDMMAKEPFTYQGRI